MLRRGSFSEASTAPCRETDAAERRRSPESHLRTMPILVHRRRARTRAESDTHSRHGTHNSQLGSRNAQVTIRLAMSTPAENAKPGKRNLAGKGSAFTVALGI